MRALLLSLFVFLVASSACAQDTAPPTPAGALDEAARAELQDREDLAALLVRYGEAHPQIIALRARLASLEGSARRANREAVCATLDAREAALRAEDAGLASRDGPEHPRRRALRARLASVGATRTQLCP